MKFSIAKGSPTPDELVAIELAMSLHKREELAPVIRRSTFGSPQLRRPLRRSFAITVRKN